MKRNLHLIFFIQLVVLSSKESPLYAEQYIDFYGSYCLTTDSVDLKTFSPTKETKSDFTIAASSASYIEELMYLADFFTPCIYESQLTITFVVSPGPNFIRLNFHPTITPGLNIHNALFTVTTGPYTLLTTTQSSYPTDNIALNVNYYFLKEFWVNVESNFLNITLTPSNISDSFAFVSGIEVVPIHPSLSFKENVPIPIVGTPDSDFHINKSISFETMYRLNVGGGTIPEKNDTGMLRTWSDDKFYLIGFQTETEVLKPGVVIKESYIQYIAPAAVYATARTSANMSWVFPIDHGFLYLIRLHFCEVIPWVISNERLFHIFINNQTAEDHADVFHWSNGTGVPVHRDYIVDLTDFIYRESVQNLWLTMQATELSLPKLYPILNGIEIFKLSDASNSLVGTGPLGSSSPTNSQDEHHNIITIISLSLITSVLVVLFLYALLIHLPKISTKMRVTLGSCYFRRKRQLWESSEQCRYFSLDEIKSATENFSYTHLIGSGGYGKVYKGCIDGKIATKVAIKRGSPTSRQGSHEFQTEIATLSRLRHCHLVSLIGYSMDHGEMILVYDLMARGNLRNHLYNSENPPLPWEKRLKICIGAARGLHYLHTGMDHAIIHRDVKTANILLNEEWVAKVSDFGLSKLGPNLMNQSDTHVSTVVKGSFGYLDPEYYRRQRLTEKSDVYSFGVVLFEVLCARPAVVPTVEEEDMENYEQVNLAEWALHSDLTGSLDQIIDPYLKNNIAPECFTTYTEIAKKCLAERGNERPTMGDVLCNLELAWHQQIGAAEEGIEKRQCSRGLCIDDLPDIPTTPVAGPFQIMSSIGPLQVCK